MIRPAPFRGAAPPNLPAGQVYRPGFLRRSLAYLANGDLPPLSSFGSPPFLDKPPLLRSGSVPSCNVLERSEHVAEWIRLTEEKVHLAQVAPNETKRADGRGHRPEGGIRAAARDLGVDRDAARRAAKVAGLSDRAKETHRTRRHNAVMSASADTALRACIVTFSALFVACAGWAVTL